jgi:hypothetical protein
LLSFKTFFSVSVSDRSRSAISHSSLNWLTASGSGELAQMEQTPPCVDAQGKGSRRSMRGQHPAASLGQIINKTHVLMFTWTRNRGITCIHALALALRLQYRHRMPHAVGRDNESGN